MDGNKNDDECEPNRYIDTRKRPIEVTNQKYTKLYSWLKLPYNFYYYHKNGYTILYTID